MAPLTSKKKQAKLPIQQLAIIALCRIAEPIALTGVNPYLPEMIESFGIPQDKISTWVGTTAAVFSLSQCLTSFSWRRISDVHGRKAAVLCSLVCAMAATLLFGISTSLAWAIVARCLSGAGNGMVGIVRTMVAELVPQKELQPRAFSILPLVWCLGNALGPIIGGALASPAKKFPAVFSDNGFFARFPFALPNIAAGGIFLLGIVVGFLFLKETLESKVHERDVGLLLGKGLIRSCSLTRTANKISWRSGDETSSPLLKDAAGLHGVEDSEVHVGWREVLTFQTNMNLFVSAVLSWHAIAFDQLVAVFLHLSEEDHTAANPDVHLPWKFAGGFGLDSGHIGMLFTVYGIFSMTTQIFLYPYLARRYGILNCFRLCTLAYPFIYAFIPFTVLIHTPASRLAGVLVCITLKGVSDVFAYPCSTIMLTNSANSIPILGAVNAMGVSTASLAKAAGPYIAGRMFSWGLRKRWGVVAWWGLAVVAVCGHVGTWLLMEMEGPSGGIGREDELNGGGADEEEQEEEIELLESVGNISRDDPSQASLKERFSPRGRPFVLAYDDDALGGEKMTRMRELPA